MNIKAINWHYERFRYLSHWGLNQLNIRLLKRSEKSDIGNMNKKVLEVGEFQNVMKNMLGGGGNPFLVARYGSVEATALFMALGVECGAIGNLPASSFKKLQSNAGFFPNDSSLVERWANIMKEASKQIDILCYWSTGYQNYLVRNICNQSVQLTELNNLQPFFYEQPWTAKLKDKKILVVHPFADTIEKQYQKRQMIWENPNILPDFQLRTVKAVQTIAGNSDVRFNTWFDALDFMYEESMKEDFDVAIVACGAYGMPLAAKIKMAGKQAIHWGGMSQIWFGIRGARWDQKTEINQFYNEAWTRPSKDETPSMSKNVEGGCYW